MSAETETSRPIVDDQEGSLLRSLESRALKGTYFIVASYGLAMGLRLVSSVVLSRLFLPNLFGLMALVTTVIVGMNLFSHVGLQENVIQNARGDDPVFLDTGWTVQVIRGAGLFLLSIPIAWPAARFYHEPQIITVLPALGFSCLISGFSSPSLLTLARHMGVGRLSALELGTQFVQLVATLLWALFQPTIWALVAGRLISELARTIASYWMLPEVRPRFMWEKESVREIVHFGWWILISTALTFLALQSDRLILARLISFRLLGLYGIAFSLSDIPRQIILQFCARLGYPFIAKFSDRPRSEFRKVLLKYRLPVLAVGALLIVAVIMIGDKFILLVYPKTYHGAAWMVAILAVGLWHTLLYSTTSPSLLSLSKPHYSAISYLVYCISLYIVLPLGFHVWGMVGAVIAVAASDLPVYFVIAYSACREGVGTLRQDALLTLGFVILLAVALVCRISLGFGSPFPHLP